MTLVFWSPARASPLNSEHLSFLTTHQQARLEVQRTSPGYREPNQLYSLPIRGTPSYPRAPAKHSGGIPDAIPSPAPHVQSLSKPCWLRLQTRLGSSSFPPPAHLAGPSHHRLRPQQQNGLRTAPWRLLLAPPLPPLRGSQSDLSKTSTRSRVSLHLTLRWLPATEDAGSHWAPTGLRMTRFLPTPRFIPPASGL